MNTERSYQSCFNSFGIATITCTLLVSIGKSITSYYFVYIICSFLMVIPPLVIYNYCIHKRNLMKLNDTMVDDNIEKLDNLSVEMFMSSNRRDVNLNVDTQTRPPPKLHFNVPHAKKEINLRKLALLKNFSAKECRMYLKEGERSKQKYLSMKLLRIGSVGEELNNGQYSMQEWRSILPMCQKVVPSLLKEQKVAGNLKKVSLMNLAEGNTRSTKTDV